MAAGATRRTPNKEREKAEHRWPPAIAISVALVLYVLLPSSFTPALRFVVVGLCAAMLLPLVILNPHHFTRETRWSRRLGVATVTLLLLGNQFALGELVYRLVTERTDGPGLLLAAAQVWVTNVIAFALVYWEMDRGGPVARRLLPRDEVKRADFRFPQDEDHDAIDEVRKGSSKESDWMPGYVDYLYFSASDSMAFSPTDAMPLTQRAKLLMVYEAFAGFVILALVIARAVSLLG
jgi:branched-subunit amino acid transport protein